MKSADGRFVYLDEYGEDLPDGTVELSVHRFGFRCRFGERRGFCDLNLRGRGHDRENKSWSWDGNVDYPTLIPSVNCKDCWHGFIEKGVFLNTSKKPEDNQ